MNGLRKQTNGHNLCARCYSNAIFFRVRSEILDVSVCVECGLEAVSLGLIVTQLSASPIHPNGSLSNADQRSYSPATDRPTSSESHIRT
jgi:hypothetical protein